MKRVSERNFSFFGEESFDLLVTLCLYLIFGWSSSYVIVFQ
jgi:hypothetical protein